MNFEPYSYQDPRLIPPDEPELLIDNNGNEVRCILIRCKEFAIEAGRDGRFRPMCEAHHKNAAEEAEAERRLMMREEV